MNNIKKYSGVCVWGAGARGTEILKILKSDRIDALVVDSNPDLWGRKVESVEISSPQTLYRNNDGLGWLVIISPYGGRETIVEELINNNYKGDVWTNLDFHNIYELPKILVNVERQSYSVDFQNSVRIWFDEILSEVDFWRNDVAKPGAKYYKHYLDRVKEKEFVCGRLMKRPRPNDVVLDVGCGICSQYGNKVDNGQINLVGIDPLAFYYNKINNNAGFNPKVSFGMFELLSQQLQINYADLILIDNALDHSIDPIASIIEAYKVLRTGGVLSIAHHIDEGYKAFYSGLHQWNIGHKEGDLIIWNNNNYVNVSQMISPYGNIDVKIIDSVFDTAPFGIVECNITKEKEIPNDIYILNENRMSIVLMYAMKKMTDYQTNLDYIKISLGGLH